MSAQRFEISPQWFSECQPEKVLSLIIGNYENLLTVIYLTCIYEDHPVNIQTIAISLKP